MGHSTASLQRGINLDHQSVSPHYLALDELPDFVLGPLYGRINGGVETRQTRRSVRTPLYCPQQDADKFIG
jgi:hypothetical protein